MRCFVGGPPGPAPAVPSYGGSPPPAPVLPGGGPPGRGIFSLSLAPCDTSAFWLKRRGVGRVREVSAYEICSAPPVPGGGGSGGGGMALGGDSTLNKAFSLFFLSLPFPGGELMRKADLFLSCFSLHL